MDRPLRIGVIGSSRADDTVLAAARGVGRALALARAVTVCGGLGGVMAAAAEGAAAEGGLVLGFLPGGDPAAAAPGVSLPVATGLGEARNVLVVRASEAVVAVAGGWGTRNEAALCLKLGIPLVGLLDSLGDVFPIERFTDPDAAVARALERATGRRRAHSDETRTR
ncbi:MAG TPA: TIGR00725 family protein [Gemmatimonadota bacterium]|nr:TIGR00725 family protein [Gemmatimonadota bacterium]